MDPKDQEPVDVIDDHYEQYTGEDEIKYNDYPYIPQYPSTLLFPEGTGTPSLCVRCLTLLSHASTRFGDGTDHTLHQLRLLHSVTLAPLVRCRNTAATAERRLTDSTSASNCLICVRTTLLYDFRREEVENFADQMFPNLLSDVCDNWNVVWIVGLLQTNPPDTTACVTLSVRPCIQDRYKFGYLSCIGEFRIYPDWSALEGRTHEPGWNTGPQDYEMAAPIDAEQSDFASMLGPSVQRRVASWTNSCITGHAHCSRDFGPFAINDGEGDWFPDRLVRVGSTDSTAAGLSARIVLKSCQDDFPLAKTSTGIRYLSLSHCWGPNPDPSAPLGGRRGAVLTQDDISAWRQELPLHKLPKTFQDAIRACYALGHEYIWIDSLCIVQDSRDDWEVQSAMMGDIYKLALFNIAAATSMSDYDGFINDDRDVRVVFGFRVALAPVLGRVVGEKNCRGKECILLRGEARLLWSSESILRKAMSDLGGVYSLDQPLFRRAWVFQESYLARRRLVFAGQNIYWHCGAGTTGEQPDWVNPEIREGSLHDVLVNGVESVARLFSALDESQCPRGRDSPDLGLTPFEAYWFTLVKRYTSCKLTYHTDKLVAISSIARELARIVPVGVEYRAGLWMHNMTRQLGWLGPGGNALPCRRRRAGEDGYVAPSWSWASVDGPVEPRSAQFVGHWIALADVVASKVDPKNDYAFGFVKAGWLRIKGRLNGVTAVERKNNRIRFTDTNSCKDFYFMPDTSEGVELVASGAALGKLAWMPLNIEARHSVTCQFLVLLQSGVGENDTSGQGFVRSGERVYERFGVGSFGTGYDDKNPLGDTLQALGEIGPLLRATYTRKFKRREDDFGEFVLV